MKLSNELLKFLHKWLILFSSKVYHTEDGSNGKYPVKICEVSDDLFGDMWAPSWPYLVT